MCCRGVLDVYRKDGTGARPQLVYTYEGKGSFGEMALLFDHPVETTVVAAGPGVLWALDGRTYRSTVKWTTHQRRVMYESLISEVPFLNKLQVLSLLYVYSLYRVF